MGGDVNMELSKILAKTMQCSYKKKEIEETILRIIEKADRLLLTRHDESQVREMRREFEELRKGFYGLK